mmetsp:Transcript_35828/g.106928  ORF Transcript_35828/g.106928 Transcript_35828/m.106928 type:complete len:221 (-) Transcript_35828:1166-1828(-)
MYSYSHGRERILSLPRDLLVVHLHGNRAVLLVRIGSQHILHGVILPYPCSLGRVLPPFQILGTGIPIADALLLPIGDPLKSVDDVIEDPRRSVHEFLFRFPQPGGVVHQFAQHPIRQRSVRPSHVHNFVDPTVRRIQAPHHEFGQLLLGDGVAPRDGPVTEQHVRRSAQYALQLSAHALEERRGTDYAVRHVTLRGQYLFEAQFLTLQFQQRIADAEGRQ